MKLTRVILLFVVAALSGSGASVNGGEKLAGFPAGLQLSTGALQPAACG